MLQPDFKEFSRLAREATLVPVVKTVSADLLTPVSAFLAVAAKEPYSFLLESVERGEQIGRYTFLGVRPSAQVISLTMVFIICGGISIDMLSAARAYVGGESLWAAGQASEYMKDGLRGQAWDKAFATDKQAPFGGVKESGLGRELGLSRLFSAAGAAAAAGRAVIASVTRKSSASQPPSKAATRMRSPGFASSRAWTSMTSGWAAPVSPHTAARLSRRAPSAMPTRFPTPGMTRESVHGRQKALTADASVPVALSRAPMVRGAIFM